MTQNVQVLELMGLPYSGKTTLALNISNQLESKGRKVIFLDEYKGPSLIVESLKQSTDINYVRALRLLQCVVEQNHFDTPSIIISDRGAVDFVAWQRFFSHVGNSPNTSDYVSTELLNSILPYVRRYMCVWVNTNFNVIMARRSSHGRFFNSETMSVMKRIYEDVLEDLPEIAMERVFTHIAPNERDPSGAAAGLISKFKL